MGAYSPAPVVTDAMWKIIDEKVLQPFLKGVQKDGLNFRGIIYAGLMITKDGPKILEFNVRFGDPETQAILMRLDSDLVEALCAVADGRLADVELRWSANPPSASSWRPPDIRAVMRKAKSFPVWMKRKRREPLCSMRERS